MAGIETFGGAVRGGSKAKPMGLPMTSRPSLMRPLNPVAPAYKPPTNLGPYGSKAPKWVTPGILELEGHHIDDFGRSQPWRAHYDKLGRRVGRTDYNAGDPSLGKVDVHHHTWTYSPASPGGKETKHIPGEFIPGETRQ